nr:hypothetical protein [Anaerolineae bacterium]
VAVFHPIPFNYLVRAQREIAYLWDRTRSKWPERDREMAQIIRAHELEAYKMGVERGAGELAKRILNHLDGHSRLEG